jgi:hypothetical protein
VMFKADEYVANIECILSKVVPDDILKIYSSETMLAWGEEIDPPACGVIYDGTAKIAGGDNRGIGQVAIFNIYIFAGLKSELNLKRKTPDEVREVSIRITQFVDTLRATMKDAKTPNSRGWTFEGEKAFEFKDKGYGYIMVYSTPVTV